ncbi:MOSC domain-containing protein [Pontibacillus halophilus]|nr:MOSC domain-containing protein [Pontibacillus halophilus]
MEEQLTIESVQVGGPKPVIRGGEEQVTSFMKTRTTSSLRLTSLGLEGDEQAVKEHHGGVYKAVCMYPYVHYAYWQEKTGSVMSFPAFGENVTVAGLDESTVSIGDVFQWGEAELQVVQPRQPCQRISFVHQIKDLTKQVIQTGFTGFYLKVLKEGIVSVHHPLRRI